MMGRRRFLKIGLIVLFISFGLYQKGSAEGRYTVKSGDTLYVISKSFGVSIEDIKVANGLEKDSIKPKQVLVIPAGRKKKADETAQKYSSQTAKKPPAEIVKKPAVDATPYVVQKGDNLYGISKKVGISIEEIKTMNGLHTTALKIGQILLVQKSEALLNEGADELGDEEITETPQAEGGKREQAASNLLGKWSNPEERNLFIKVVKTFLGVPYRLGGSTLKGIDCSAFVKKIYEIFNVDLPRTAREQFRIGKQVEKDQLEEGDLVFFKTRRNNNAHVGIYIGDNKFVHASSRNKEVKIDHLDIPYFNQRFLKGVRVKELERDS
jgi:LysM repeat protein